MRCGMQRKMIRMSRRIVLRAEVSRRLGEMDVEWAKDEAMRAAIAELEEMRLLICEGEKMLGVPVSARSADAASQN